MQFWQKKNSINFTYQFYGTKNKSPGKINKKRTKKKQM